jgi:hypothetical protein
VTDGYKKKQYLIIIGLIIFNIIAYNFFVKNGGYDMIGNYIPHDNALALKSSLMAFLVAIPIVSFILGAVFAIIPYKKLQYTQKYKRSATVTLLAINSLFSAGLISIMMMTLIGWYPGPEEEQTTQQQKIEGIKKFEAEVMVLADSSNYYFDLGIKALDKGGDPIEISKLINEPLKRLQTKINLKSRSFSKTAFELQLTLKEYDSVFGSFGAYIKPIMEKYNVLVEKGVKVD